MFDQQLRFRTLTSFHCTYTYRKTRNIHHLRRFAETDVAMMLTLLRAAGFRLRSADPIAMKRFVLAVHARAAKAAAAGEMSSRAEVTPTTACLSAANYRQHAVDAPAVVQRNSTFGCLKPSGSALSGICKAERGVRLQRRPPRGCD